MNGSGISLEHSRPRGWAVLDMGGVRKVGGGWKSKGSGSDLLKTPECADNFISS